MLTVTKQSTNTIHDALGSMSMGRRFLNTVFLILLAGAGPK